MIEFTIYGEPASKANSRKIVNFGTRLAVIKSDKARKFEREALQQIPPTLRLMIDVPVRVTLRIFYASHRPDLDESVILDVLQNRYQTIGKGMDKRRELVQRGVIVNDRQVREKHVFHGIDKANPRTEIMIEKLDKVPNEL